HDKRQPKVTNAAPAPRGKDHFASGEVVILMSGLLCGKQGVIVGQASAKNHYRVKVGAMEVTVDTADLRPAT
ncbi:hypothetical protein KKF84_11635, partial [Myxococcota bacterium]|nr:hypothetical protein [Myxococcota bacterium]